MDQSDERERKLCPNCGHNSRASAKVCSNCGYAFFHVRAGGVLRKRCAHCGFLNRHSAKVCSNCGSAFRGVSMISRGQMQKWCPQCGKPRKPTAKVCGQCGYRFKTTPIEPPVVQSNDLAVKPVPPSALHTPPPPPIDPDAHLRGEPAPYLPPEEFERLRQMGSSNVDIFVRLFDVLRNAKRGS